MKKKDMKRSTFVAIVVSATSIYSSSVAAQSAKYDGVYSGTQTLTSSPPGGNYSKCLQGPFKRQLLVKNDAVTYVYNPTYKGKVAGTVDEDGSVSASAPDDGGV